MTALRPAIFLLCCFLPITGKAQSIFKISLYDASSKRPLQGAAINLRAVTDTSIFFSTISDKQGKATITAIPKGSYLLQLHSLGYQDIQQMIQIPGHLPDSIFLTPGMTLKEVTIKDNLPPVRMKGDTIEYNAEKFKTKDNAVVEDLLRKLPGVNVERDGTIKAQGKEVQRILVDGKEFFGSDPSIATRNLPADMIDKVQVLDKQSDMAEFTGVADGEQIKTINLVTKKNRKRGFFGNASAGAGTNGRYEGGFNVNSFTNDMQLSALGKGNNVNKSGFSSVELLKLVMQDKEMLKNLPPAALSELSRMKGVRIEGNAGAIAELARPAGLTDTKYGGLNFNNDWDNFKFRSSYFFNDNHTRNSYDYARQYRLPDTSYNYLQAGNTAAANTNHRIDLSGDVKFNPRTSLKITPQINLNNNSNQQDRNFQSYTAKSQTLLNNGAQTTNSNTHQQLITSGILLRHRLSKPGRTFLLDAKPGYFSNTGESYNKSTSNFFNLPGGTQQQVIDQKREDKAAVYSLNTNIVYTEPLARGLSLQAGQQFYYSQGHYNRLVFDRASDDHYNQPDALLSDKYNANTNQYTSKLSLAGNHKRLLYTVGAGWQQNNIKGNSDFKGYHVAASYKALLPEAYAEWKPSKYAKVSFRYKMETTAPTVADLQPLEDNSDPLYIRQGNPFLDQKKMQRINFSYNNFKLNGRGFYANADIIYYNKDITDSSSINSNDGKQRITPVNVNGNFNFSISAGRTINFGNNGSSFSAGLSTAYSRNTTFTNSFANVNRTISITPDMRVNYYLGDHVNIGAKGSAAWNKRTFSGTPMLPENNWLLLYGVEGIATLPADITLEANTDGFSTLGMAPGFNNTILLLNAALTKTINKSFSIRAEACDLLNRNSNINRINGNGYIEDRRNNALGRYFLLSAVYKFRHFPTSKK
ncbi:outer membrane beta-barrel protein [Chitinophaga sp. Hz27]|uniref:outer membrane beta-barrel protein n=1 Tax=Chitinophaga sp. Hz27 TaxID=3347169 RepID=UPI0035D6222D